MERWPESGCCSATLFARGSRDGGDTSAADACHAVAFYPQELGFRLKTQVESAIASVAMGDLVLWLSGPARSAAHPLPPLE